MSDLRSYDDDAILKQLRLGPRTATELARDLRVDDGALASRLAELMKGGLVQIVSAKGPNPVWDLTDSGRERSAPS